MLDSVERVFEKLSSRLGRFPAMVAASVSVCAVFCNQTVGAMMCAQLMGGRYGDAPDERTAMMLDMENSVITIAGLVPWCIACSVPVRLLDCGMAAVPFAAYLYLTPICWYIHLKRKGDVRR